MSAIIGIDPGRTFKDVELRITIPGQPCAKGRPRMAVIGGHARAYTDRKTENYEGLVCMSARAVTIDRDGVPTVAEGPVRVRIVAVFERPAYLRKRSKRTGLLIKGVEGRMPHTSRPDLDNVIKSVLDGLNRSGLWNDDRQVVWICGEKWIAAMDETAHVEVALSMDLA